MKKADIKKIQAFKMWYFHRILNISWVVKAANVEVLRRIGKKPEIINNIKSRKLQYFGHKG